LWLWFAGASPAGCQKKKAIEEMLQIDAEVLKSNSKAVVDGLNSAWQGGDEIRFGNGLTKIHFFLKKVLVFEKKIVFLHRDIAVLIFD